jgi:hypothetical protein
MEFFVLLKFGQKSHLESFCSLGECYMQSIEYFRNLEGDEARGDRLEGTRKIWQPQHIGRIYFGGIDLDPRDLVGPVKLRGINDHYCNLFCMYCLNRPTDLFPIDLRVRQFGEAFAVVTNTSKFLHRFKVAAQKAHFCLQGGFVTYFDIQEYSGETGTYRKSGDYEWQREYRLALSPGSKAPIKLMLGDLRDITKLYQATELGLLSDFTADKAREVGLSW